VTPDIEVPQVEYSQEKIPKRRGAVEVLVEAVRNQE